MRKYIQIAPAELNRLNHRGNLPVDTVVFGDYPREDELTQPLELTMIWYRGDRSPKLECFHDVFLLFEKFSDLFTELGKRSDQPLTPQEFCTLLSELEFHDETPEIPWQQIHITLQPNDYALAET
jgi:hypothetical protein